MHTRKTALLCGVALGLVVPSWALAQTADVPQPAPAPQDE